MLGSTIKYASEIEEDDFRCLFARVSGWISEMAKDDPNGVCTLAEVNKLLDVLLDQMWKRSETEAPAAGTTKV